MNGLENRGSGRALLSAAVGLGVGSTAIVSCGEDFTSCYETRTCESAEGGGAGAAGAGSGGSDPADAGGAQGGGDVAPPSEGGAGGSIGETAGAAGTAGAPSDLGGAGAGGAAADPCAGAPCANGGECLPEGESYRCDCTDDFSGPACEEPVESCEDLACVNGACPDESGAIRCECEPGYEGDACDLESDECADEPCDNDGTCVDELADFRCECAEGFDGDLCQIDLDECEDEPCENGGVCLDEPGGYSCECGPRYVGENCEFLRFQGMGVPDGYDYGEAWGISDDGRVAVGNISEGRIHAVRFVDGVLQDLGTPAGADSCFAYGVNVDGSIIVGMCDHPDLMVGRPVKYTPSTGAVFLDLSPLDDLERARAMFVSGDNTTMVGWFPDGQPFRLVGSEAILLGTFVVEPGANTVPHGVSGDGSVIVGSYGLASDLGWSWSEATGMMPLQELLGLEGQSYHASDVSYDGRIIVGDGGSRAIRWVDGEPEDLGPGAIYNTSADGSIHLGSDGEVIVLWSSDGVPRPLLELIDSPDLDSSWEILYTMDMSADGKTIVGDGTHNGRTEGWVAHLP